MPGFCDTDTQDQAMLRDLFCNYYARLVDERDHRAAFSDLLRQFNDGLRLRRMGEAEFRRRVKVAITPWQKRPARGGCDYCGRPNEGDQCQGCGAWRRRTR
ncbi:MAG TPA: hypothetical protein VGK73_32490 [Polyangiaceae bacterium]